MSDTKQYKANSGKARKGAINSNHQTFQDKQMTGDIGDPDTKLYGHFREKSVKRTNSTRSYH